MSHEAMIESIKAELNEADTLTIRSILETLRAAKQKKTSALPQAGGGELTPRTEVKATHEASARFIGENPLFDPNRNLSLKERAAMKRRLKEQNREWLSQQFKELHAAWLMVVDGKVIASGEKLSDYPKPDQILDVSHRVGKFPFLFVNEDVLAIEESGSGWSSTIEPSDFYPSVPVKLGSKTGSAAVIGDFDTGASSTFVDYDWLVEQNIIQLQAHEETENARHLNQIYEYLPRSVLVEVVLSSG
jgi:hypothetical protein